MKPGSRRHRGSSSWPKPLWHLLVQRRPERRAAGSDRQARRAGAASTAALARCAIRAKGSHGLWIARRWHTSRFAMPGSTLTVRRDCTITCSATTTRRSGGLLCRIRLGWMVGGTYISMRRIRWGGLIRWVFQAVLLNLNREMQPLGQRKEMPEGFVE